jgi:GDP-4-dehydro-6-deoxy-D-mannose reductase
MRDFVDVRDAARALLWMAESGEAGAVYHVCSGVATSVRRIVDLLVETCGRTVRIVDAGAVGPGARASVGSHRKLTAASGWEPAIPLEQSVRESYQDWATRVSAVRP